MFLFVVKFISFFSFSQECEKGPIALPETSKPKEKDSSNTSVALDKVTTDEDGWFTIMI